MDARVSQLLNRLGGLYRDPNRVDKDASVLLRSSAGLHLRPQIAAFVENNGNSSNVLCLQGTIAIHYRGNTYQQLMDIYLPAGYPVLPPKCYVRLAPNMYLKEKHPHVGPDGQVYMPFLSEWRPRTHSLIELVVSMSSLFSADPPVFTRTTPLPPPPPPSFTSTQYSKDAEAILAAEAEEANRVAEAARRAEKEEEELAHERERQRKAQEEWDAKSLAKTKEKVNRKIYTFLQTYSKETKEIVEQDMQDQRRLEDGKKLLEGNMSTLQAAKTELKDHAQVVEEATKEIQEWLNDAEKNEQKEKSIDEMIVPTSPVDRQMMDLCVENASLTDALYFLDRSLHKQTIDLTTHLRQVRKLSKKQFLVRAHMVKIKQSLGL